MPIRWDILRIGLSGSLTFLLAAVTPSPAGAADFVGAESCRACHQAAYDTWKNSPHARAFRTLSTEQQKDTKCLQCHARDLAQGGDAGVSCETCHGAGQYYWPEYVMRDKELSKATGLIPGSEKDHKACLQCHDATSPSLVPFDPAKGMQAIDHWSKDKAARSPKTSECPRPARSGGQAVAIAKHPAQTFLGQALRQAAARGKSGNRLGVQLAAAEPVPTTPRTSADPSKAD